MKAQFVCAGRLSVSKSESKIFLSATHYERHEKVVANNVLTGGDLKFIEDQSLTDRSPFLIYTLLLKDSDIFISERIIAGWMSY